MWPVPACLPLRIESANVFSLHAREVFSLTSKRIDGENENYNKSREQGMERVLPQSSTVIRQEKVIGGCKWQKTINDPQRNVTTSISHCCFIAFRSHSKIGYRQISPLIVVIAALVWSA